jgi:hypothetical protein
MLSLEQTAHRRLEPLIRAISVSLRNDPGRARLCNTTTVAETPQRNGNAVKRSAGTGDESRKCNFSLNHPNYDQTLPLKLNIRNLLRPGAATVM